MIMRVFSKPPLYHFHHRQGEDLFDFLAHVLRIEMKKGISLNIREVQKILTLEEAREAAIIASSKTFVQNYKDWLQFSALKQFNKCQCQNCLHPGAELGSATA